jgi:enoyl-CoA hydratase/carnithine racemase
MSDDLVLYAASGGVVTVTLNRPQARNALDGPLRRALWNAIAEAGSDDHVAAVVLTGKDPAFCAGIDLAELADARRGSEDGGRPRRIAGERDSNGTFHYFPVIDQPIIAAVNGPAITGGFELALQCTMIVASVRATFADTHTRMGVMPGAGLTVLLTQAVGVRRATGISLTGRPISAEEAVSAGLAFAVVAHDELIPRALAIASDIAKAGSAATRRLLKHYRELPSAVSAGEAFRAEAAMAEEWNGPPGSPSPL